MGKAIVVSLTMIIIILGVAILIYRHNRKPPVGDLTVKQERELRELVEQAYRVMNNVGIGMEIEDTDVVSPRTESAINNWMTDYASWSRRNRKELNA